MKNHLGITKSKASYSISTLTKVSYISELYFKFLRLIRLELHSSKMIFTILKLKSKNAWFVYFKMIHDILTECQERKSSLPLKHMKPLG